MEKIILIPLYEKIIHNEMLTLEEQLVKI